MRAAAALVLLFAACAHKPHAAPTSGPPATEPPQVLGVGVERHDFTPSPPTTVPTTTTTQPVTITAVAVPVTAAPPVRFIGACGGWEDIVVAHFGDEAGKACDVIRCETGGTFDPTIENPRSTASGLAQFLDSTWVKARAMVGAEQYPRAKDAPGAVQIAAMAAWKRATSWSQWVCA